MSKVMYVSRDVFCWFCRDCENRKKGFLDIDDRRIPSHKILVYEKCGHLNPHCYLSD